MLPHSPPHKITKSEQNVFKIIRDAHGTDQFACLHSLGLARHHRKSYGEADFILICPHGVFCLEVKGGEVHRQSGIWTIGWPGRSYESSEGPFRQSQQTTFPLIDELKERESIDFKQRVMVGWGVIFPDTQFAEKSPEWDLNQVCDSSKLNKFSTFIEGLAVHTRQRESMAGRNYPEQLSNNDINRIVNCFRRDFDLVPSITELTASSSRELRELSDDQYRILQVAVNPDNPRVICSGGAGTGKTLLCIEAARRIGRTGKRVLLLCFNRLLATHIKREFHPEDGNIQTYSLHQFMRQKIIEAGLRFRIESPDLQNESSDTLFSSIYPEVFQEAMIELLDESTDDLYDSLIVDEGQDILFSPIIDSISEVLAGGFKNGQWILMYDPDLQSELYGRMNPETINTLKQFHPINIPLIDNFRNPKPVMEEMCRITGMPLPNCRRNIVSRVVYKTYNSDRDQGKKLRALLIELLSHNICPSTVTILSARARDSASVTRHPPDVGKRIVYLNDDSLKTLDKHSFCASSIHSFKGLENDIIILTDISPSAFSDANFDPVIYVGMTRARTQLYCLVDHQYRDQYL